LTPITAAITLFFVFNPFANAPLFVSLLADVDPKRHRKILLRECLIALAILVVCMLIGPQLLVWMGLTQPALGMAGGLVLFLISLRMLFPTPGGLVNSDELDHEPFIVPIAVPMIAGPSSIATVMLLHGYSDAEGGSSVMENLLAVLAAWGLATLLSMLAPEMQRILGKRLNIAVGRLMGLLLTVIAVQMMFSSIEIFVNHIRST